MAIDINGLSAKELETLITQAKKRKTTLNKRKPIAVVRKKIATLLKAEGYTVAELFGTAGASAPRTARAPAKKASKAGSKVAPKYRNPANAGETWAGRGKQPRWLAAYTGTGRRLDDFLIK